MSILTFLVFLVLMNFCFCTECGENEIWKNSEDMCYCDESYVRDPETNVCISNQESNIHILSYTHFSFRIRILPVAKRKWG
jgi:hypothetical protein